jgi:uncharacterized phiE125 gp8 family phage protein
MGFKVITPPTEPVTLADARLHLRVTDTAEDTLISALITAAREYCEHYLQRAVGSQTLELALDEFPEGSIELPMGPVTSITSIKYIDTNQAEQTLSGSAYTLDDYSHQSWAVPAYETEWPETLEAANVVKVRYVAGSATPPSAVLAAMKLIIGHLYENREQSIIGVSVTELPLGVKALLDTKRIWSL